MAHKLAILEPVGRMRMRFLTHPGLLTILAALLSSLVQAGSSAAEAAAAAESTQTCGVSAMLNEKGYFRPAQSMQPVCGHHMTTNCSVSYSGMQCPSGCSFLVPNQNFVCVFECVAPEMCSNSNSDRAFPDPVTGLCLPCEVEGCKLCESSSKCSQCREGFELTPDGSTCVFYLDRKMHMKKVRQHLRWVIVALVLLALVWRCVKGSHEKQEENLKAITRARRHRRLCKVHDWQLGNPKMVRERYPLTVDVHRVHILGVGLPLFYNSICFLAVIAMLFTGVTFLAFNRSGVGAALASTDRSNMGLLANAVQPAEQWPAVVLSPLAPCGHESAFDIMQKVRAFATTNFHVIGLLYVITFALSLAYGKIQLITAKNYDAENKTMADFALRVSGLRKDLTDEAELTRKMQEAFRASSRTQQLASRQMEEERGKRAIEVVGVSICYDYLKEWSQVDGMRDRFLERMDVDMQTKVLNDASARPSLKVFLRSDSIGVANTSAGDEDTMRRQVEEDRKQARAWFDKDSPEKLNSTGDLFVVLKHVKDRDAVLEVKGDVARRLQALAESADHPIQFSAVHSEPPSINWWHMGVSNATRDRRVCGAMLKILGIIVAVQLLLVLPYAKYIVWPYSRIGSAAGGTKMQIAGMILGNVNMFVSLQIFFTSYGLGFRNKDSMDMMVFCANTGLVMVNTFFNVVISAIMVFSASDEGFGPWIFTRIESLVAIGVEGSLASSIYNMMMPGTFFVGYLMCIVMAGVVPYAWNSFLMKLIYVWRCLPDSMLSILKVFLPWAGDLSLESYPTERAERGLEPMEIGISWDYSSMIVNPTVCFCMLFFVSPYVWKTFLMLFLSMCFYYCFCRYQHLRFCKACYYTTNRLDTMVNFLWGIPLSVIGAAWCLWGIRSGHIAAGGSVTAKFALVGAAFFASLAAWMLSYRFLLDPWKQQDAEELDQSSYEDVQADMLYTWFNCNPVYTLKCEYYFKDACRTADSIAESPEALRVTISSARGLRDADSMMFAGHSEPYCVCEILGKPQSKHATPGHADGADPVWNFTTEFAHFTEADSLVFTVLDRDFMKKDDVLGKVTLSGDQVAAGFDGEVRLDKAGTGVEAYLKVSVLPPQVQNPQTSVRIKGASGLRDADCVPGTRRSDPYCICEVVGKPCMQLVTPMNSHRTQPMWDFSTGLDMEADDTLVFTVLDDEAFKHSECLGQVTLTGAQIQAGVSGKLPLEKAGQGVQAYLEVEVEPSVDGLASASRARGGHPLACGEDDRQVRFFQVGKEYLFVRPERQGLVERDLVSLVEFETYLEVVLRVLGRLAGLLSAPCPQKGVPALPAKGASREVLLTSGPKEMLLVRPEHEP